MFWEILLPLKYSEELNLKGQEQVVYTVRIKNNDMYFCQFHMIIRIQDII